MVTKFHGHPSKDTVAHAALKHQDANGRSIKAKLGYAQAFSNSTTYRDVLVMSCFTFTWVAAKELSLSCYIGETTLNYDIYTLR